MKLMCAIVIQQYIHSYKTVSFVIETCQPISVIRGFDNAQREPWLCYMLCFTIMQNILATPTWMAITKILGPVK